MTNKGINKPFFVILLFIFFSMIRHLLALYEILEELSDFDI